jgi:uncharacterized protein (UPF0147 family)
MTSFQNKLKSLMAEYDLGVKSTEGLTGDQLTEMNNNNEGMTQLFDAIDELHKEFLAAVPKPKRAAATKTKTATTTTDTAATAATATTTEAETSSDEDKPKKKRAPAKKKAAAEGAESAEPKAKSAKSAYSTFSPHITKGNKGELDGWDAIMVDVSFNKTTEASAALLESSAELRALKDTKQSMGNLLKACKAALQQADGKVVIGKLSGIMWSAVGNVSPF